MKQCVRCKEKKDLSEFSLNKGRKDGLNSVCKKCYRKYQHSWYLKNKEVQYARVKKNREKQVLSNKKNLFIYLKDKSCKNCDNNNIVVLQFHHRDRTKKIDEVGHMVNSGCNWNKTLEEISKCDILCSNCHVMVTYKQMGWKGKSSGLV